jgi:hypothetical protein
MTGVELIAQERQRQIDSEGFSIEHDDSHTDGELAYAAACYASPHPTENYYGTPHDWPFSPTWWKPSPNNRIRDLVKAGALIVAEIERLQRLEEE